MLPPDPDFEASRKTYFDAVLPFDVENLINRERSTSIQIFVARVLFELQKQSAKSVKLLLSLVLIMLCVSGVDGTVCKAPFVSMAKHSARVVNDLAFGSRLLWSYVRSAHWEILHL